MFNAKTRDGLVSLGVLPPGSPAEGEGEMSSRDVLEALAKEVEFAENEGLGAFNSDDLCLLDEEPCLVIRHEGKFHVVVALPVRTVEEETSCKIAFDQVEAIEENRKFDWLKRRVEAERVLAENPPSPIEGKSLFDQIDEE